MSARYLFECMIYLTEAQADAALAALTLVSSSADWAHGMSTAYETHTFSEVFGRMESPGADVEALAMDLYERALAAERGSSEPAFVAEHGAYGSFGGFVMPSDDKDRPAMLVLEAESDGDIDQAIRFIATLQWHLDLAPIGLVWNASESDATGGCVFFERGEHPVVTRPEDWLSERFKEIENRLEQDSTGPSPGA